MRTRITTAVVGAVALLTLTACSAEPDAPAAAEPAAQEGAQKATEERLAAAREAAGVPDEPTGAARTELIAAIAEVAPEAAEHEQKAVIAAQNQCAAMHAKAPKVDWLAAQRFSYEGVKTTEAQGKKLNAALERGFCAS
ncbi:hypothetical protein [Streptomyces sp. NPDC002490]|uniref:hypothetical protein n=1 Tax=Streptomyces sp. NPDC002490 TaxID=3154416 RepID=UPI0033214293